jgi:hypothetical protein
MLPANIFGQAQAHSIPAIGISGKQNRLYLSKFKRNLKYTNFAL